MSLTYLGVPMTRKKLSKKQTIEKLEANRQQNEFQMSQEMERLIRSWSRKGIPLNQSVDVMTDFFINFAFQVHASPKDANHEIMKSMSRQMLHLGELKESELNMH
jgi:hypothetical protein